MSKKPTDPSKSPDELREEVAALRDRIAFLETMIAFHRDNHGGAKTANDEVLWGHAPVPGETIYDTACRERREAQASIEAARLRGDSKAETKATKLLRQADAKAAWALNEETTRDS